MPTFTEPLRSAWRHLRGHAGFSFFAVLVLAAAIGGATLLLSLYDSIAWRRLPVSHPDELVSIRELTVDPQGKTSDFGRLSLDDARELRAGGAGMGEVAAYAQGESILAAGEVVVREQVQWVSPEFFDVLGVQAQRGRTFVSDDDPQQGGAGGVVLSDAAWQRFFARDPEVVGRTILMDGEPQSVLGVAPTRFRGFVVGASPALFAIDARAPSNWAFFHLLARLEPGTSAAALESRLAGIHAAIRARQPERRSFMVVDGKSSEATERIQVADGSRGESRLRGSASQALLLVAVMMLMVLGVLAANLANLLAVRALSERSAAAIRLALGAPRALVAATWFVESLLLAGAGALLGTLAAAWGGSRLLLWANWVDGLSFEADARSIALAVALALATAVTTGALAAWEQARVLPGIRLREESPTSTQARTGVRWRNGLLTVQVALTVVLLAAMGQFVRSVDALLAIDTGFPLTRVLTLRLDLPEAEGAANAQLIGRVRDRLAELPGVVAAGYSSNPILGGVRAFRMAEIEGYAPASGEILLLDSMQVDAGFFDALELPFSATRPGALNAYASDHHEVVVNRRFVERYLGDAEPLGHRLSFHFGRPSWNEPLPDDLTIAGVVDDRMVGDVRETPAPRIYAPFEADQAAATLYLRSSRDPRTLAPAVERVVRALAPQAALGDLRTLSEQRDRSLRGDLLTRNLALTFGTASAWVAALGLFAVLSYLARGRRRELGLRQALGARPGQLVQRMLRDGLRPVAWGVALGLLAGLALARLAESQLYGVSKWDAVSFVGAALLMALVGLAAMLLPALRAASVSPADALRSE